MKNLENIILYVNMYFNKLKNNFFSVQNQNYPPMSWEAKN